MVQLLVDFLNKTKGEGEFGSSFSLDIEYKCT